MSQSFLIVATDPVIESLVGELVRFAGHQPTYVSVDETGADAIHKRPPFGVLVDASYRETEIVTIVRAARERHVVVVYFASSMSAGELREFAQARNALWFALPNGPSVVGRVLGEAVLRATEIADDVVDPSQRAKRVEVSHDLTAFSARATPPAIAAALAALERAQSLVGESRSVRYESGILRSWSRQLASEARSGSAALRDAVHRFASSLREHGIPADQARAAVKRLLFESALSVADEHTAGDVAHEALDWVAEVYAA